MSKRIIKTDKAPAAVGPYSQGVVIDAAKIVFTAGQIPLDPNTGKMAEGDIEVQTKQALENLKSVLEAAGTDMSHVVKTTVFLKDMNDFTKMNEVYKKYFTENPPARSAVEVSRLPKGAMVEIECIAYIT